MASIDATPKDNTHTLHLVLACMWIPAVAFLIPHGVISLSLVPVLAIIPMTVSLFSSLFQLSGRSRSAALGTVVDLFVIAFLIGTLTPGLVLMARGRSRYSVVTTAILGTYGTVPCMVSLVIHTLFVLRRIPLATANFFSHRKTCPHCDGALSVGGFLRHRSARTGYERVPATGDNASDHSEESHKIRITDESMQETGDDAGSISGDPRPSTDDETARLV